MVIINRGKTFTDKQIYNFLKLLGKEYEPKKLIICDSRIDILKCLMSLSQYVKALFGKLEGICNTRSKVIYIFTFSENDDGNNKQSIQLYSLHALSHEARHLYQSDNNFIGDKEKDADRFATSFINHNKRRIKEIMKWENEWTVEEE